MTHDIIINPNTNTLYCKRNNKTYNIASGDIYGKHHSHPYYTPVGETTIVEMKKVRGEYRPAILRLGFRTLPNVNIRKKARPYLIHGPYDTNAIDINGMFKDGGRLSKGCIRFNDRDLLDFYNNTRIGDSVLIIDYEDKKINDWVKRFSKND
jgi:lipoprotein-anchoring transpeptidase ErfK/SrfK